MPFLLAPAGSPEGLRAALAAGADEVYLGGDTFNARINARNFGQKELIAAGDACKNNNVRLFITLNTLVSDRDFSALYDYIVFLENKVMPDAYIIQDVGLAVWLKKTFPNIIMHASTQMQQHSSGGVRLLKALGFSRIVLARETSEEGIRALCKQPVECEVFVHGALCVSMSGGCLMSSMIGKRSGNRGECAQPCRLTYSGKNAYPLSLKDLCLAGHIPKLTEMGVTSLKIEGRMKSPDYVYAVTSIYRRLLDENRSATRQEKDMLRAVFSRSGFTDGYFMGKTGSVMFGVRRESDKRQSREVKVKGYSVSPRPVQPAATESAPLLLPQKDHKSIIPANKQKGYVFRYESVCPKEKTIKKYYELAARIDLPIWKIKTLVAISEYADKVSVILPRTVFDSDRDNIKKLLEYAYSKGIRQVTLSNIAHIELCAGFNLHGDYSLNVTNSETLSVLESLSFSSALLSPETSPRFIQPSPLAKEYIVYGRIPLMQTENCIIKNTGTACGEDCGGTLIDRTNAAFPIKREYAHRSIVYNSVPIYIADKIKELKKSGVGLYTLLYLDEHKNVEEFDRLIDLCVNKSPAAFPFTRGYYK